VRRIKADPDGGDAYASRVVTLSALFLGAVTVLLIVLAPYLLRLYLNHAYFSADRAAHLESIVDLTRWCLPQVFFYGMYVLAGQILNARERFGPMMWAPIANNVVSVAMLVLYLAVFGRATEAEQYAPLDTGQEVLLGLGSTIGIAAQLLVLLPYLRTSGFLYRPRFDFRDPELRHTLSLGKWTVLFVVVTQLAYLVVVNLASGGTVQGEGGTGYTIYSNGMLLMMVPHSIVTVSLATAILPRMSAMAADRDLGGIGHTVGSTLRTSLAFVVPFAVLVPILAGDIARGLFGWGSTDPDLIAPTIALFAPALVPFTVHYLVLRGFYALEANRRVFFIQCALSLTNVVVAWVLVTSQPASRTAPMLVVAYASSYVVGAAISLTSLRREVGGIEGSALVRFLVRMLVVLAVAGAATWLTGWALTPLVGETPGPIPSLVRAGVAGLVGCVVTLVGARVMRVREVTSLVDIVAARLRRS
jgi:putative peptidoglycan lipid II flippase